MNATSRIRSILWMISWSFSFSIAMALSKCVTEQTSAIMIVFVRSIFGIFLLSPFVLKNGIRNIRTNHPFIYLFGIIGSTIAMVCTYYAYGKLPLATATSIGFTGPCISVLVAMMLFSEKVSPAKWGFIILGYTGVVIIANPGAIDFHPAILVALLGNLLASCGIMATKILTKEESSEQIAFLGSTVRMILLASTSYFFWTQPSPEDWIYLGLIGLFGTMSQFSYIQALKFGQISMVSPFEYCRLVIAIPIGILFFAEIPTIWVFIGSLVIIASNFGLTYIDQIQRTKVAAPQNT